MKESSSSRGRVYETNKLLLLIEEGLVKFTIGAKLIDASLGSCYDSNHIPHGRNTSVHHVLHLV